MSKGTKSRRSVLPRGLKRHPVSNQVMVKVSGTYLGRKARKDSLGDGTYSGTSAKPLSLACRPLPSAFPSFLYPAVSGRVSDVATYLVSSH